MHTTTKVINTQLDDKRPLNTDGKQVENPNTQLVIEDLETGDSLFKKSCGVKFLGRFSGGDTEINGLKFKCNPLPLENEFVCETISNGCLVTVFSKTTASPVVEFKELNSQYGIMLEDCMLTLLTIPNMRELSCHRVYDGNDFRTLAIIPGQTRFLTGSDKDVSLWEVKENKIHRMDRYPLPKEQSGSLGCDNIVTTQDGNYAACQTILKTFILDVANGQYITHLENAVGNKFFLPLSDGDHLLMKGRECNTVEVLNIPTGQVVESKSVSPSLRLGDACLSSNDKIIFTDSSFTNFKSIPEPQFECIQNHLQKYYSLLYAIIPSLTSDPIPTPLAKLALEYAAITLPQYLEKRMRDAAKNQMGMFKPKKQKDKQDTLVPTNCSSSFSPSACAKK